MKRFLPIAGVFILAAIVRLIVLSQISGDPHINHLTGDARAYTEWANTIAAGALIFALSYFTLEIRRLYHGRDVIIGLTTGAEQYTYSIAWLTFGVVLLGIGVIVNSERARLASAAVIANPATAAVQARRVTPITRRPFLKSTL